MTKFNSIALALAASIALSGSASAAQVWVAPAAQKIRPDAQAPAAAQTAANLAAAKNEFEAFQVVVTGAASGVSMSLPQLADAAGHTISGRDITLYREALLNVPSQTGGDGAAGMWPDALIPDVDPIAGEKRNAFPFDVAAGQSTAVYVDVHVPAGIAPGAYTGTLVVSGGVSANVPVTLTVWDLEIPSTSTLKSAFGMAWNGPCAGHGDPGCSNSTYEMQLRARYVQAALDNRISISQPYYTATAKTDGSQDWSAFDTYAGPFLAGTANTRLQGAKLTAVNVNGPMDSGVVAAWAKHASANGWYNALFAYVCDEPPLTCSWSDVSTRIAAARAGDTNIPTLVTTTVQEAQAQGINSISLYVPVINFMDDKPGASQYSGDQRSKYPATAWWYQSCMSFGCSGVGGGRDGNGVTGWPTYAVDSDATRNRAMEWLSFSYNMQGELYYETTQSFVGGSPWTNQTAFGGTGDGTLFYPGTTDRIGGKTEIPVESLRMKHIRDGMEDYELLHLAETLGLRDQAVAIARQVYPATYQATTTPAALDAARAQIVALVLKAQGKTAQAPATTTGNPSGGAQIPPASSPLAVARLGGGGCSSGGAQQVWLAVPMLALFALRRRRLALARASRR